MSYSFIEPDWPAYCECRYDEARDEMDREDCPFHSEQVDEATPQGVRIAERKTPTRTGEVEEPAA